MSIFIGNLPYEVTGDDLKEVFGEYGKVKRVYLPKDQETGKLCGYGFVEMKDEANEETAIDELHEAEWLGRKLRVNKAKPRQDKSKKPRIN